MRIDVHAHLLPADLPDWRGSTGDARWPAVAGGRLELAGKPPRPVDEDYWSLARRTELLDQLGIDVQVLSPLPALLPWWADAPAARDWCRWINNSLAEAVATGNGRLLALGIVPLQDPEMAAAELDRIADLGLSGVELGTAVDATRSFASPDIDAFLAACVARQLPVLLHPNRTCTVSASLPRLVSAAGTQEAAPVPPLPPALDAGLGLTTDTAFAVSERLLRSAEIRPNTGAGRLSVCLAHGGGSLPWLWSRVATNVGCDPELPDWISLDTAGCTPGQVDYLVDVVGPDRVLLGTDLPAGRRPSILNLLAGLETSPAGARICQHNPRRFFGAALAAGLTHRASVR